MSQTYSSQVGCTVMGSSQGMLLEPCRTICCLELSPCNFRETTGTSAACPLFTVTRLTREAKE